MVIVHVVAHGGPQHAADLTSAALVDVTCCCWNELKERFKMSLIAPASASKLALNWDRDGISPVVRFSVHTLLTLRYSRSYHSRGQQAAEQ